MGSGCSVLHQIAQYQRYLKHEYPSFRDRGSKQLCQDLVRQITILTTLFLHRSHKEYHQKKVANPGTTLTHLYTSCIYFPLPQPGFRSPSTPLSLVSFAYGFTLLPTKREVVELHLAYQMQAIWPSHMLSQSMVLLAWHHRQVSGER